MHGEQAHETTSVYMASVHMRGREGVCCAHRHIPLVKGASHEEHHIVNHVPVSTVVHESTQWLISLHSSVHLASAYTVQPTTACLGMQQALSQLAFSTHIGGDAIARNTRYLSTHVCPHAVPVIHQLLCASVYDGGCVQWRCFIGQVGTIVRPTLQWKAHLEGGLGQHVHKGEVAGRICEEYTYEV